jgi:hypothetical protein
MVASAPFRAHLRSWRALLAASEVELPLEEDVAEDIVVDRFLLTALACLAVQASLFS